ncbi:uncharacterized protein LOC112588073 [Harpegnathos saltator]|uniref:uncharacterized protein LOC112588073 n=1 Tax=Harpegnathos saltator TaxID=610380 RepID=UPI000DBEEB1E|nr:uncharacterized protein LOC112588073 [Harpegnathos saltator]
MMAEDWKDCANNDIEIRKVTSKARISHFISNAIAITHTVSICFYGIGIILTDVDVTDHTIEIPHMYKIEVLFEINTQNTYRLTLIMELLHLLLGSLGMGILNALLLVLILHIGGQIDILISWLTELMSVESANKHRFNMMKKIIRKHQKIIYFAENIEKLYTIIALLHFVSNVAMICILGFLIITVSKIVNKSE